MPCPNLSRTTLVSSVNPHVAGCSHEAKASIGIKLYERICQFYGYEPGQ